MEICDSAIPEVKLIKPKVFGDERGFFLETWNRRSFADAGISVDFVQDNHSLSVGPVLRGLHYQIDIPQGKLVRVITGAVFDVAVDMRRSSDTFGQWVGFELSDKNNHMLWVPEGFAHGFLTLSEKTNFVYKCTEYYFPEKERALAWNDETVGIDWPIGDLVPQMSGKDLAAVSLDKAALFK